MSTAQQDFTRVPLKNVRDMKFENRVASLYDESLPYHNFGHVQDTLTAAAQIIERCHEERIRVDTKVVYYALLFHDAGYRKDHEQLGFESKEAYSAALAEQYMTDLTLPQKDRVKVCAAIMATHRDAAFVTAEQKLVRAADLAGLSAPYATFLHNTVQLWKERCLLTGPIAWQEWRTSVRETLDFYLSQEIRLTSYYCDKKGSSTFHLAVEANLQRFCNEPPP